MVSHFILFNNVVFYLKLSRGLLFLHYVLIEVLKQSNQQIFYSCYICFCLKMCFSNGKRRGGLRKANKTNFRWAQCKVLNHG